MKFVKKIILGFLVVLLVNLFVALTLNIDLSSVIVNGVIKEVVKQQIISKDFEEANTIGESITSNEQVNEILNSKEVQELINKYVEISMESIANEEEIDEISLEEDMIQYIKENKKILEEKIGVDITDEMIEKTTEDIKSQELNKTLKEALQKAKEEIPEKDKVFLKGYVFLTSIKLRLLLIGAIILDILLIALIQMSLYKWIKNVGDALLSSGIGITIMSLIVKLTTSRMLNIEILHTEILTKHGVMQLVLGLVIIVTYKVISKKVQRKKEAISNEISEESSEQF